MKNLIKGFTSKMIKGQIATGAYSHQENNKPVYVVAYNNTLYYGSNIDTMFNELAK